MNHVHFNVSLHSTLPPPPLIDPTQGQVSSAPTNELKQIFILLLELLMMEDPLQRKRLKLAVEGNSNNGLLGEYSGPVALLHLV